MDEELIGREDEQAQLQAWVTEALAGRGSLVLLGGEAGVGKTTLVQHSLATSGLQVLEGFAVEGGTSPFGPVVEALRSYLRAGGVPLLEVRWLRIWQCCSPNSARRTLLLIGPRSLKQSDRPWRQSPRAVRRQSF